MKLFYTVRSHAALSTSPDCAGRSGVLPSELYVLLLILSNPGYRCGPAAKQSRTVSPGLFHWCYGPEFTSRAMYIWAKKVGVKPHFVEPGKPTQNALVNSIDGMMPERCLDPH